MPSSLETTQIGIVLKENKGKVDLQAGIGFLERNEVCGNLFSAHPDRRKRLKTFLTCVPHHIEVGRKKQEMKEKAAQQGFGFIEFKICKYLMLSLSSLYF